MTSNSDDRHDGKPEKKKRMKIQQTLPPIDSDSDTSLPSLEPASVHLNEKKMPPPTTTTGAHTASNPTASTVKASTYRVPTMATVLPKSFLASFGKSILPPLPQASNNVYELYILLECDRPQYLGPHYVKLDVNPMMFGEGGIREAFRCRMTSPNRIGNLSSEMKLVVKKFKDEVVQRWAHELYGTTTKASEKLCEKVGVYIVRVKLAQYIN